MPTTLMTHWRACDRVTELWERRVLRHPGEGLVRRCVVRDEGGLCAVQRRVHPHQAPGGTRAGHGGDAGQARAMGRDRQRLHVSPAFHGLWVGVSRLVQRRVRRPPRVRRCLRVAIRARRRNWSGRHGRARTPRSARARLDHSRRRCGRYPPPRRRRHSLRQRPPDQSRPHRRRM